MARPYVPPPAAGLPMPGRLRIKAGRPDPEWWSDGPLPDYVSPDDAEGVRSWRLFEARRNVRAARMEYLRKLDAKPKGVSNLEWAAARGVKYADWQDR